MEQNLSKIFGLELLSFEAAELYKVQGQTTTFLDEGTIHVLYFEEQIRFLLSLNYWDYALVKQLTVTSLKNHDKTSHSYAFPASDGFFILKLFKIPGPAAIENFETILKHTTNFHHEGEEVFDGMELIEEGYPESSMDSQKLSAMSLMKKGIAKVTDRVMRTFIKSHKENPNLKEVKDIDTLKNTSRDFLSTHEYSKDDIENAVNRSKDFCHFNDVTQRKELSHNSEIIQQKISFESSNKVKIEQEIENSRRIQEEARIMQEEHKRKEQEAIQRERELEALLLEKQSQKKLNQESILQAELEKKTRAVQEEQEQIELEHKQHERREQELMAELQRRINELKSKERMTENELSELTLREQEMILSTERLETEKRILEKRLKALSKKLEKQEEKIEEFKQDTLKVEKELLKKEEDEVQRLLSEEIKRLRKQEEMVHEERTKYKRMEDELSRIIKEDDKKRTELEKAERQFDTYYGCQLEELEKQRSRIESGKSELEQRAKSIEEGIQNRVMDLKQRKDLTEREMLEVELREGELAMITQLMKAEELKTRINLKECWEDYKKRESEVRDHEEFIEDQSQKLVEVAKELELVAELEEKEKRLLNHQEQIEPKIFGDRFERLLEQERINEIERDQIQREEEKGRILLQKELVALKGKELLNEAEKLRCEKIERKLSEINEIRDSKLKTTQEQLDEISQHEANLLIQNQELLKGHIELKEQIERLEHEATDNLRNLPQDQSQPQGTEQTMSG